MFNVIYWNENMLSVGEWSVKKLNLKTFFALEMRGRQKRKTNKRTNSHLKPGEEFIIIIILISSYIILS